MTIVDMPMQYSLRLSRFVKDEGLLAKTYPYSDINQHH